ncbi:hypothetical protein OG754_07000 [Streptomyces decoyicus]|nr:hypothetical protein [Streptomyces decoyicus]
MTPPTGQQKQYADRARPQSVDERLAAAAPRAAKVSYAGRA